MKLLQCLDCHDIVKLFKESRRCRCGKSEGAYEEDGLWAWYRGNARVLGMRNQEMFQSYIVENIPYKTNYSWFVINDGDHVQKKDEDNTYISCKFHSDQFTCPACHQKGVTHGAPTT